MLPKLKCHQYLSGHFQAIQSLALIALALFRNMFIWCSSQHSYITVQCSSVTNTSPPLGRGENCTSLQCSSQHFTAMNRIALHCTALNTLHCIQYMTSHRVDSTYFPHLAVISPSLPVSRCHPIPSIIFPLKLDQCSQSFPFLEGSMKVRYSNNIARSHQAALSLSHQVVNMSSCSYQNIWHSLRFGTI